MREEKKSMTTKISFPPIPFLLISKPKIESVDRMCKFEKVKQNVLCGISTLLDRKKCTCLS